MLVLKAKCFVESSYVDSGELHNPLERKNSAQPSMSLKTLRRGEDATKCGVHIPLDRDLTIVGLSGGRPVATVLECFAELMQGGRSTQI